MTTVEVMKKLADITAKHGELPVMLPADRGESVYEVESVGVEVSAGEFPDDWNMPEGFQFVLIG